MANLLLHWIETFKAYLYDGAILETVDGVKLCAFGGIEKNLGYLACTLSALDLVEQYSPRHYSRIKKHLSYIVDSSLLSGARYERSSKACVVDFDRMNHPAHGEWMCWHLAGVLVHEATHGLIAERGIEYSKANRARIERICSAEENRFLRHAPAELQDSLIRPFRVSDWSGHWEMSRWRGFWNLLRRQRAGSDFTG